MTFLFLVLKVNFSHSENKKERRQSCVTKFTDEMGWDGTDGTDGEQKCPLKFFKLCGHLEIVYIYLYTK